MSGGNPAVDFNEFEKYSMHILRSPNIKTVKPEVNTISDKYQYKDKFILNDVLSDVKLNKTPDTMKKIFTPTI